jgi:hypothetical protein
MEVDILATVDGRFAVLRDLTPGPSTTGRGRAVQMPLSAMTGFLHRDRDGTSDRDAPIVSLGDLIAPLRTLPKAPSANLQLDLKILERRPLSDSAVANAADAVAGLEDAIVVGSHHLDEVRRLVAAIPGARLG